MCQHTTTPGVIVADRDIICYKKLKFEQGRAIATNWYHVYTPEHKNPLTALRPQGIGKISRGTPGEKDSFMVESGYHSFVNKSKKINGEKANAIFIIPKGTEYTEGFDNGWCIPTRVSSTIIYVGRRWSPFTWLKLLKYKTD